MAELPVRLSSLLSVRRNAQSVVAWRRGPDGEQPERWGDFLQRVAALSVRLREHQPGPFVLACNDPYAYAVGLLALWGSRRCAIAPPNTAPGSLDELTGRAVGVLSDHSELVSRLPLLSPLGDGSQAQVVAEVGVAPLADLDPQQEALELFTSGTTGAGKPCTKTLRQLEIEVAWLETRWGAEISGARIFSTASHQHLYGLLFGVLWPLCAGRAFHADGLLHGPELFPVMRASGRSALASVPSHLRRMAEREDAASLRDCCAATFSSGGPLAPETADRWSEALGAPPVEIFGSTETGGVAWRVQRPGPDRMVWTPFDIVSVSRAEEDGRLVVQSPLASSGSDLERFTMGDRVELLDGGRFVLEGRADRVVKVGEKRLSLPLMEEQLRAHPHVEEAALLAFDQGGEARVGAVVVVSSSGSALVEDVGRRTLTRQLAEHLAQRWDRVLLPRAWRIVEALPEDAQGKVTARLLRPLFEDDPDAIAGTRVRPEVPRRLEERRGEGSIECICLVPDDLAQLEGHFPGLPVVPGVAQVGWALGLAEELVGAALQVRALEALKFPAHLRPGARFRLRVETMAGDLLAFRVWHDQEEFASGRIRVQRPGEEAGG